EKYLIKWQGHSYLHVSWESRDDLVNIIGSTAKAQIKRFRQKEGFNYALEEERGDGEYFDPTAAEMERV
ncbi:unnamed protein product, partial [Discosporangium mesarthrocarpum]